MLVFLIHVNEKWKTGLFNAVESRVRYYSPDLVLNISYVDSFLLRIFKYIFGKDISFPVNEFYFGNILVKPIYIKRGLLSVFFKKLPFLLANKMKSESLVIKKAINNANLKAEPVDLIAHWGETSGIYAYFIGDYLRNFFIFYHGSDVHTHPKNNKYLLELTLASMNAATLNFFVSQSLLKSATELGYKGLNNAISYNGVDIKSFSGCRMANKRPVVAYAGNLFHIKGADLLPAIFEKIKQQIPEVIFKVVGDGDLTKQIVKEFASKRIDVEFLGKLQPHEMPAFYSSIDVLIMPSRNEGLPLAAIECLSSGCNVIATKVGGLIEVIENEYLVEQSDYMMNNFADKVYYVLKNKPVQILNPCFDLSVSLKLERDKVNFLCKP